MAGSVTARQFNTLVRWVDRLIIGISRHWLGLFLCFYGFFVLLPWLSPVLMHTGYESAGRLIQALYSAVCHQYPERSFFLYGPKTMYSIEEIQAVWPYYETITRWRQFIGTPEMGWKVAWSDRMISMYTSVWVGALIFRFLRRRLRPLPTRGLAILALPILLDGGTHMINDLLGLGFRQDNAWLAALTGHALPASFYAGDALGSFNSWMRLITGALFGLGVVWFAFPWVERAFQEVRHDLGEASLRSGAQI
jgi:uncharacterized membrane protein